MSQAPLPDAQHRPNGREGTEASADDSLEDSLEGPAEGTVGVVIPAAGAGTRMGGVRKSFLEICGRPVLAWSLAPFLEHREVGGIAVALAPEDAADPPAWLLELAPRVHVVAGGETRADSVRRALEALPPELDIVVVHDGARPLVIREWIDACVSAARRGDGAVLGHPSVDTLKRCGPGQVVTATEDRTVVWQVQTPQAFPRRHLEEAYKRVGSTDAALTDDASLVEAAGFPVRLVRGGTDNLKVTFPSDAAVAEALLQARKEGGGEAQQEGGLAGGRTGPQTGLWTPSAARGARWRGAASTVSVPQVVRQAALLANDRLRNELGGHLESSVDWWPIPRPPCMGSEASCVPCRP